MVASSYSGNLKSHLMKPSFTEPIDTLKDVVDSGLPWAMVTYGGEAEGHLNRSGDQTLRMIWDNKIDVPFSYDPDVGAIH